MIGLDFGLWALGFGARIRDGDFGPWALVQELGMGILGLGLWCKN